jgi:uncharacterized protein YwgA
MTLLSLAGLLAQLFAATESVSGRKTFQKLLYFAQVLGWPTRFRFGLSPYGPFSHEAAAALELLRDIGVVILDKTSVRKGPAMDQFIAQWTKPADALEILRTIAELPITQPDELELMATVHYFLSSDLRANLQPKRDSLVADVSEYEGKRFREDTIGQSFDRLRELQLVPAFTPR